MKSALQIKTITKKVMVNMKFLSAYEETGNSVF